ncbi:MAG: DUF2723 domain-containing protein [Cyclobacteriaceae bacterium]|nr:DUF2723 domain-containing protein [Cyclobacteriaceae bacterium]
MKKFLLKYYAELTGLFVFLIYLQTLCPTVTEFDSGELITVQATLGIAHPTGYPLFTILGYLFSKIPLPISIAYKLNLLCAIWCAATVIILVKTMKLLLDNINVFMKKNIEWSDLPFSKSELIKTITAISTGLVFAFSYTFWAQATKTEVYSLQLFLYALIIYFGFKAFLRMDIDPLVKKNFLSKDWLLVSIFVGLGFANHMMTIYLLPFLTFLFFSKNNLSLLSLRKFMCLTIISFTISVLLYLSLLLSAQMNSGFNLWLLPNFTDWISHVRGKMYYGLVIDSLGEITQQLKAFVESLMIGFSRESRRGGDFSINILFVVAGIVLSAIILRKLFYTFMSIIIVAFLFSISYAILDIQEYFLLIFYSFSFFWGICIYYILSAQKISANRLVRLAIPVTLIFLLAVNNYKEIDRSDNYLFEDYINALFDTMEPNSILITNQWDTIESPAFYFQKVEGRRRDLEIVNLELLTFKSYKMDLKKKYAIVNNNSLNTINLLNPLNPLKTYIASEVIRDYIYKQRLILKGSVYLVPHLLTFKISNNNEYIPAKDPTFKIRIPRYTSMVDKQIIKLVCSMLVNRIEYELHFNKADRAKVYYKKLITDFPMYLPPSELQFLSENI